MPRGTVKEKRVSGCQRERDRDAPGGSQEGGRLALSVSPSSGPRRKSRSSRPVSGLVYPWGMPDNSGARLLDGASVARTLRERLRTQTQEIRRLGAPPFLRVIVVGEDPASI